MLQVESNIQSPQALVAPERKRSLPFVRNLEAIGERFGRLRAPHAPLADRARQHVLVAAALLSAVLVLLLLFTLDGSSPAWPRDIPRTLRHVFQGVTRFGRSDWLLIPTGVFCLALVAADWDRTSRRIAAAWTELGHLVAFFFVSVSVAGIATNVIKWSLGRSRPVLFKEDGPYALTPFSFDYAHVSFPSGHATTVAAAAMALVLVLPGRRWVRVGAVLFAVAVAVSRVMVRAHYPSDVVGGLFVGIAVTVVLAHVFGRRGIAFQSQADGTLLPRTAAVRGIFGAGQARQAVNGLLAAWSGAFGPDRAAPVDKRRRG